MVLFWILTAGLALAVSALLGLALLRGRRDTGPAAAFDLQVYRDQLKEIDRDAARGVIPADEADRLRTEVSRRILAADAAAQGETAQDSQPQTLGYVTAGVMGAVVLGGAFLTYLMIGQPGYGDLPLQARIQAAEAARTDRPSQAQAEADLPASAPVDVPADYMDLVERLRGAVAERPGDLQGLQLLARSEAALGNYNAAWQAQQRIVQVKGDSASARDWADLADMKILAAGGYVSPEAQRALEEALARDPENGVARYYGGLMMAQTGRPDIAFRMWDRLLREGPADAPWLPPIRAQIEEIAFRAGIANYEMPQPPQAPVAGLRGPTAEDMDAAQDMDPQARMDMIRGMVEGLGARLATQGGSPQEWARLVGALGVLGETERAAAIWAEAQTVFAEMPEALELVRAAAQQAGVAN